MLPSFQKELLKFVRYSLSSNTYGTLDISKNISKYQKVNTGYTKGDILEIWYVCKPQMNLGLLNKTKILQGKIFHILICAVQKQRGKVPGNAKREQGGFILDPWS